MTWKYGAERRYLSGERNPILEEPEKPSGLLDFTKSPYVAAFCSAAEARPDA
jgi:hypothetical protein